MGREALSEDLQGSAGSLGSPGGLLGGPERVGRPSRMLEKVQEAIPEVWEGSKGPLGSLGRFVRPTWKSGKGQ